MATAQFPPHAGRERLYELSADIRRVADGLVTPESAQRQLDLATMVKSMLCVRRLRKDYLGNLFADPAWDMLLDLFAAHLEGRHVSVSSLCAASAVPPTTALRWIGLLEANGLVVRRLDPKDHRRVYVEIVDDAAAKLTAFLSDAQSASVPLI